MNKVEKAIYYAERQVENNSIYLWGGSGEKVKKLTAYHIVQMETNFTNCSRVLNEIYTRYKKSLITKKTKAYDCSGLVICALQYAKVLPEHFDDTANGLMKFFTSVNRKEITKGDVLFKCDENGKAFHTGLYVGDGYVVEAKGRDYGVVKTKIDAAWNAAGRPEYNI